MSLYADQIKAIRKTGKPVKHVVKEGVRYHVISWDSKGPRCSEPNCEINTRRQEEIDDER